jgi:hypothetical protein
MLHDRRPRSVSMAYLRCRRTGWRLSLSREPTALPRSVHMMLLYYTLTMTLLNPSPIFENSGCPLNHAVFGSKVREATKALALTRRVEHLQGRPVEMAAVGRLQDACRFLPPPDRRPAELTPGVLDCHENYQTVPVPACVASGVLPDQFPSTTASSKTLVALISHRSAKFQEQSQ